MYGREGRKEPQECDEVIISRQPGENRKGGPVTPALGQLEGTKTGVMPNDQAHFRAELTASVTFFQLHLSVTPQDPGAPHLSLHLQ